MRILLLSCSFPPIGGMTPLLAAHIVRELHARGHSVDVLTIAPGRRHPVYRLDDASSSLVPPGVRVTRAYAGPLHHLAHRITGPGEGLAAARTRHARGGAVSWRQRAALAVRPLLVPDSRIDCAPWVIAAGRRLLRTRNFDAVFSISPPDSGSVMAWALAAPADLPWVAHVGDLWSVGPVAEAHGLPRWRRDVDRALEARLLARMDRILVLTPEMRDLIRSAFPRVSAGKFRCVTVGYDPREYDHVAPEPAPAGVFRIVYTGIFYEGVREPYEFFAGLESFAGGRADVEVVVAGNVSADVRSRIAASAPRCRVTFTGHLSHDRVVALQKGASALLLFCYEGGYSFPAKTVEYIAARRPILAVDYDGRDPAARYVSATRRGVTTAYRRDEVADALRRLHLTWTAGELASAFDLGEVSAFSWSAIGSQVEAALLEACASRPSMARRAVPEPA